MEGETKNIPTFILVLVAIGLVVGVGLVVLHNFAVSTLTDTTVANDSVAISSQKGTLTYTNFTRVISVENKTAKFDGLDEFTFGNSDRVTTTANISNGNYNITYVYGKSGRATGEIVSASNAIGDIPNTWLSLIVTVFILSVILLLVIRSFGSMGNR